MEIIVKTQVLNKLKEDEKFLKFLRENSNWYKELNRNPLNVDIFIKKMKEKYKLRTIDRIDSVVDSVDLITKIINA
jgi:hypothetical protein